MENGNENTSNGIEIIQGAEVLPDETSYPFPYYLPIAQFALRLLGVYAAAVGGTYTLQYLVEFVLREPQQWLAPLVGGLVGNVAYMTFGIYLASSGRWVIEEVFLPPQQDSEKNGEDS